MAGPKIFVRPAPDATTPTLATIRPPTAIEQLMDWYQAVFEGNPAAETAKSIFGRPGQPWQVPLPAATVIPGGIAGASVTETAGKAVSDAIRTAPTRPTATLGTLGEGLPGVKPGVTAAAEEYGGTHRPPMADSGAPLYDLTGGGRIYPDDVYSPQGPRYYGTGRPEDTALFKQIHALKDKPDAPVKVYRAVPTDAPASAVQHGDWVTISKRYAQEHGESALRGHYKIIEAEVPAKALFTNGDSPYEFGLDLSVLKPAPLTAFHGSPHDFERFSSAKIGTGEGAQAYGHGLYFAEKEQIANEYRKKLSKFGSASEMPEDMAKSVELDGKLVDSAKPSNQLTPLERAALAKHYAGGIQQRAIEEAERDLKYLTPGTPAYEMDKATLDALKTNDLTGRVKPVYGRTYEVNLHTSPDELLDWDAPLSQQPPKVQAALKEAVGPARFKRMQEGDLPGHRVYEAIGGDYHTPEDVTDVMKQSGIKGIRYLDHGSRGGGVGFQKFLDAASGDMTAAKQAARKAGMPESMIPTHNYVIFDDRIIEIAKKYGVTLAVAAEMYRRATQPQMGDLGQ